MTKKLREKWKLHSCTTDIPDVDDLIRFCCKRMALVGVPDKDLGKNDKHSHRGYQGTNKQSLVCNNKQGKEQFSLYTAVPQCKVCEKGSHQLYSCPDFKAMDIPTRISIVNRSKLCLNCLGADHSIKQCRSKHSCRECRGRHHTLLHKLDHSSSARQQNYSSESTPPTTTTTLTAQVPDKTTLIWSCQVLLSSGETSLKGQGND